jgi:HAD superfamily hydrolase (TIGR01484 family)
MTIQSISSLLSIFPTLPKVLFTDVDDTLTWQGQIPKQTFSALSDLRDAGIRVVPVTGASAGWCDCLLKTLPVENIIGENGAFWMQQSERGHTLINYLKAQTQVSKDLATLKLLAIKLNQQFPTISFTQDQSYRLTDVALDIGQAVDVDPAQAKAATQWLRAQGVSAHLSSIHINTWIGTYNKATGAKAWLDAHNISQDKVIFIGDSPNDEAMFEYFEQTVGVANIQRFLPSLDHSPKFITQGSGGEGFTELVNLLLGNNAISLK